MKLCVQELTADGIEQVVRANKNIFVTYIRPHIYRHNFPIGSLKLQIYDDSEVLVAESDAVDIADIGTSDYAHGNLRFDIKASLVKDADYTLKLIGADGYTFAEEAYCGWVNSLNLGKYPMNGTPGSHFNYPYEFEVWERTVK